MGLLNIKYIYTRHRAGEWTVTFSLGIRLLHLNPHTAVRVDGHVGFDPNLLRPFPIVPSVSMCPLRWRLGFWIRVHIESDHLERLGETGEHRRGFVIRKLLSKTDSWTRIERKEHEWVRDKIRLNPIVQESVWVELAG